MSTEFWVWDDKNVLENGIMVMVMQLVNMLIGH